jgi:hypothetical protein
MTLSIEIDQKTEEFLFIGKQSYEVVTKYTADYDKDSVFSFRCQHSSSDTKRARKKYFINSSPLFFIVKTYFESKMPMSNSKFFSCFSLFTSPISLKCFEILKAFYVMLPMDRMPTKTSSPK